MCYTVWTLTLMWSSRRGLYMPLCAISFTWQKLIIFPCLLRQTAVVYMWLLINLNTWKSFFKFQISQLFMDKKKDLVYLVTICFPEFFILLWISSSTVVNPHIMKLRGNEVFKISNRKELKETFFLAILYLKE